MTGTAERTSIPQRFVELVRTISARLDGKPVDPALETLLQLEFPKDGPWFVEMEALCRQGCAEGWLCGREQGGIKFGRPVRPTDDTHGFSVDVVEMDDVVGPHHSHPNGEIDMVMPIDGNACFDGVGRGWKVYEPGSAHNPTVSGGRALVLYLLPQGAIAFTHA